MNYCVFPSRINTDFHPRFNNGYENNLKLSCRNPANSSSSSSAAVAANSLQPGASSSLTATASSTGISTGQKEAIEKKRQEALLRKRTHGGISPGKGNSVNSLANNHGNGINTTNSQGCIH